MRILLQTTIPGREDDWHVGRFSLLREHLASLGDFQVKARDHDPDPSDPVLSNLDSSDFDELWLIGVDGGDGLSEADSEGINRFHARGGGLLVTRDHENVGSCLCALKRVGPAHYFHSTNPDPDPLRRSPDDTLTAAISWPNYHSGRNGDYQPVTPTEPLHPLLLDPSLSSGRVERFPAHPHEGGVGVPPGESARVIATGRSLTTSRNFNLVVAFERTVEGSGRAIAESSFHHLADYNWDTGRGCPSFVAEPPGDGYLKDPEALRDILAYTRNLAFWLAHGAKEDP